MLEKYFTQLEASLKAKLEAKATARRKFVYEIITDKHNFIDVRLVISQNLTVKPVISAKNTGA